LPQDHIGLDYALGHASLDEAWWLRWNGEGNRCELTTSLISDDAATILSNDIDVFGAVEHRWSLPSRPRRRSPSGDGSPAVDAAGRIMDALSGQVLSDA